MKCLLGTALLLLTAAAASPVGSLAGSFTKDIDYSKLTGTWFLGVSTDYDMWSSNIKCFILNPFDITQNGFQLNVFGIYKDSPTPCYVRVVDNVVFLPQGDYIHHPDPETNKEWFYQHPVVFSTNYHVFFYKQAYNDGRMGIWIYTRHPTLSQEEINFLLKLGVKEGVDAKDLIVSGCAGIKPQEYFKD